MSEKRSRNVDAPQAIGPGSPEKRLSAIIRRLGGQPSPTKAPRRPVLPSVANWGQCEGQTALGDDGEVQP